jgi:hypothetical protein
LHNEKYFLIKRTEVYFSTILRIIVHIRVQSKYQILPVIVLATTEKTLSVQIEQMEATRKINTQKVRSVSWKNCPIKIQQPQNKKRLCLRV